MFSIAKLIAGLFGWDISKVQRVVVIITLVLIALVLLVSGLWLRSCWTRHTAKLDAKQAEKLKIAIQEHNDERVKEILAEADTKEDNLDAGIKQAEENTRQAKKSYDGWSSVDLAAEGERRLRESQ